MKIIKKIKQRMDYTYKIFKEFGFKQAFLEFLESILFIKCDRLYQFAHKYKYNNIKKYLMSNYYYELIKKFDYTNNGEKISDNSPIFVFWWQGENDLPPIVKSCIDSIKRNSKKHEVVFISKNNYKKYVEIPQYIIRKFECGKITITHFSDILRVSLLYEYGGFWMDATLYLTHKLSDEIEMYSFYTIKHNLYSNYHVCKGLWSGNFLASSKNNNYIRFIRDALYLYWKKENLLIGYLLIDCCMAIGYENNIFMKELVDRVPINNSNTFDIDKALLKGENTIKNNETYIFKLSFKKIMLKTNYMNK